MVANSGGLIELQSNTYRPATVGGSRRVLETSFEQVVAMTWGWTLLGTVRRRPLVQRLLRPTVAFVGVVLAGVVGFTTVEGVGVVDAAFWLIDPTSIELHFQTHTGPERLVKGYAVLVRAGLVISGLWIGETLLAAAFGGQITAEVKQMQRDQEIEGLADHVIICGYGTFGQTIVEELTDDERSVVVIENDETQYQQAIDDGVLAVQGDARRDETLAEAGVDRASTVVGAIDDSNANIQISIAASQLAPDVTLVVRAGNERDGVLARRAGADTVVIPEVVSGKQVMLDL